MPSYNINGEKIQSPMASGGPKMGCGGNDDDCNCGKACCCTGIALTALILIIKYTC